MSLHDLQQRLADFAHRRDWEQFHTPKNLVMALAGEAGELVELFQWLTAAQSSELMSDPYRAEQVRDEMADVFSYLLRLADVLDVDLEAALRAKIARNEQRYPEELARGRAEKHNQLLERKHQSE
ncbi:nucleotide pyrophosphohydrolase [Amycolatopsis pigmentata]|uniref:Nucleotide pyrophosphohydrolase n=1 Tax=Amycolatopsis pigmentata TaxID=450801 RepID=A0ABW5FMM0_9PSEU